jgi:3-oxoacyl-[acyl-carrier protein] reductase
MIDKLNLTGKKALVGGSTQGIGKAIAIELAKLNAQVTLIARNQKSLEQTIKELPTPNNQQHDFIIADYSDPKVVEDNVLQYIKEKSAFHIVINNTGGPPAGPVNQSGKDEFRLAFEQHLICNQIILQANLEFMKSQRYGRVINIISTSVKQPIPNLGVSNTIRGAVANWSKTLSNELGEFGITVNNVLPGTVKTQRLHSLIENIALKTNKTVDEVTLNMQAEIPAKRFAETEELAYMVAFLSSPAASYINGINIPIDGGRTKSL